MSHRQKLMSLIMSGDFDYVVIKDQKEETAVNCFLYQGDCFQTFYQQSSMKNGRDIPLEGIQSFQQIKEAQYEIVYETEKIELEFVKKNSRKKKE